MQYPLRNVLRLYRASIQKTKQCSSVAGSPGAHGNDVRALYEKYKDKIIFNSLLEEEKVKLGYFNYYNKTIARARRAERQEFRDKCLTPLPVALKYIVGEENVLKPDADEQPPLEESTEFQLPFAITTPYELVDEKTKSSHQSPELHEEDTEFDRSSLDRWMENYEQFNYSEVQDEDIDYEWRKQYGTPDPNYRVSSVKCGGCGALLHCSDPGIPGYLPSEILKNTNSEDLHKIECQRCHFLKEYNIALNVTVQPEEYEKLLQNIRHVKSLVVLIVDLLDFPCSIWPGIVDIIGTERPIIVVGNKVDLLPGDSVGYLRRVRESLQAELSKTRLGEANVKHVALVSAKTGYGVENLVSAMFKLWLAKGDVFLVGATNVGKSSLFNALLQSDYCKVHAHDLVHRATVSRWPGTTLNLLKFPINRPSGWKIFERTQRLRRDQRLMKTEKEIRRDHIAGRQPAAAAALVGRTFAEPRAERGGRALAALDERHPLLARSKWLHDTPGAVLPAQAAALLTADELLLAAPARPLRPRTFYLRPGTSLLVAGLARLDLLSCAEPCRFTVFCSARLPLTVVRTEHAAEVYAALLGSPLLAAPAGGAARLRAWPGLARHEPDLMFEGAGPKLCCGDAVLSSVAWVAVTARAGCTARLAGWTPLARGVHARVPALLPHAVTLKGRRVRDTPAYMLGPVFVDDESVEELTDGGRSKTVFRRRTSYRH